MTTVSQQSVLNRLSYDQAFGRNASGQTNFSFQPGHTSPQIGAVKDRIRQALGNDMADALGLTRGNTLTAADQAAIRVYQAGNGLKVDGIIGAETGRQARDVGQSETPITDVAAMRRQLGVEQSRMHGAQAHNLDRFVNPQRPPVAISADGGTRLEPSGSTFRAGSTAEMARLQRDVQTGPATAPTLANTAAVPPTAPQTERDAALARDVQAAPAMTGLDTLRAAERRGQLQTPAGDAELVRMPNVQAGAQLPSTQALLRAGIPERQFAAALEASLMRDVRASTNAPQALQQARALISQAWDHNQGPLSGADMMSLQTNVFNAARERDPASFPAALR